MKNELKVFLVEDSELIREKLGRFLSAINGVKIVGFAEDAEQALKKINELNPGLITLDLRLKNSSGLDVLKDIKSHHKNCKVIILTNFSHKLISQKCLESGADYFLDKSSDFEKLADICRGIVA
jgi:two-component system, NarL family, response regulator DevR